MRALLAVELRRATARRLVRATAIVVLLVVATAGTVAFLRSSRASEDEVLARAHAERARQVQGCVEGHYGTLSGPDGAGPGDGGTSETRRAFCEAHYIEPVEAYERDPAFNLSRVGLGIEAVSPPLLIVSLLLGASLIGAEWPARGITTLLTWEPRRARVLAAKAIAAAVVAFAFTALVQALLVGALTPAAVFRGTTEGVGATWARALAEQIARTSTMGALAAVVGMSLATIGRNTAAALGVAFGYLSIAEGLMRAFRPGWQSWLFTSNMAVYLSGRPADFAPGRSVLQAALLVAGYALALYALATVWFKRAEIA